jgi:cytochrome bd-type quinol oxidase subunit 2
MTIKIYKSKKNDEKAKRWYNIIFIIESICFLFALGILLKYGYSFTFNTIYTLCCMALTALFVLYLVYAIPEGAYIQIKNLLVDAHIIEIVEA